MIRIVTELGGAEALPGVVYAAISAAVIAGLIGGIAIAWLTAAAIGGE